MHLLLVGLNHSVAGIELRERAAVGPARLPAALRLLNDRPELSGALLLSTCGRTEVYATGVHLAAMGAAVRECLAVLHPDGYPHYARRLYSKSDPDAAGHLFRVAAGIDSLLVGESQVLGQLRAAIRSARRHGRLGTLLEGTADRAVAAARDARRLTGIGRGAVSIGQAASAYVAEVLGTVAGARVLVLGAGEVGELAVRTLARSGAEVKVASRTAARAGSVAERHGGERVEIADLPDLLESADVLVCSSSSPGRLIDRGLLEPALGRRARPLVILDLALPRDVEPEAASLPGVEYLEVDTLSTRVTATRQRRRDTAAAASAVLEEKLAAWRVWWRTAASGPTLAGIAAYADEVRLRELRRSLRGLEDVDPLVVRRMEALSRSLVSKLLTHPISYLRSNPEDRLAAEALERVFRGQATGPPPPD